MWFARSADARLRLRSALLAFPFSQRRGGVASLRIYPLDWSQPALLDEDYQPGLPPEEVWPKLSFYRHSELNYEDLAYELTAYWDLWQFAQGRWELVPVPVQIQTWGPQFDPAGRDPDIGQLRLEWEDTGLFLAETAPWTRLTQARVRANLESLLKFIRQLDRLPGLQRRSMSTESGWDLVQQLQARAYPVQ